MMHNDDIPAPPLDPPAARPASATPASIARHEPRWQPLPPRARGVMMLSHALGFGIPALALAITSFGVWINALSMPGGIAVSIVVLLLGVGFGAWLGAKKHRYTYWMLDDDAFGVRRGRMFFSDVRVPTTRVQHIDLKRGPLERKRDLSTLVVHTAGTREHAVTVPCLDMHDAERLRDTLARFTSAQQHDDDA